MFKEVHVEDIESRAGAPQIAALLAHYRSLAKDGGLPSYADFNAERLAEHASNLAVVEPIGGGDYASPRREYRLRGNRRAAPQSRQNVYDSAVADCMQMWDSGTHMTKQEWSRKSCVAIGDQMRGSLSACLMAMAGHRDHVIHLELLPLADIEGTYPGIDVRTESPRLVDVIEDLAADVLLIGFGQSLNFRYRALQSVRHGAEYTMRLFCSQVRLGASPAATGLSRAEPATMPGKKLHLFGNLFPHRPIKSAVTALRASIPLGMVLTAIASRSTLDYHAPPLSRAFTETGGSTCRKI